MYYVYNQSPCEHGSRNTILRGGGLPTQSGAVSDWIIIKNEGFEVDN